ncbi:MAG: hypothetical protein NVS9B15_14900 [Acidobacteriaceae bacterium]
MLLLVLSIAPAVAQSDPDAQDAPQGEVLTVFPHPDTTRYWVSGQANFILQAHPGFRSPYSGTNSLKSAAEEQSSRVFTLYLGYELRKDTEIQFDVESSGGRGLGDALGLAGFTNLDVVRNPELGPKPYIARIMLLHTFALSSKRTLSDRTAFSLETDQPERRLSVRVGKFGAADFLDTNAVGTDSHLQFTNWTIDNNGGYDYAADTRGYTYGAIVDYEQPKLGILFGELLMPKVANGIELDWNRRRARAENLEVDLRPEWISKRKTNMRLLAYVNHANMGTYSEALRRFAAGVDKVPDVILTRRQGTVKYGFGLNADQELSENARAYVRAGWNEGAHESFAYTEVNDTMSLGADYRGTRWHRASDRVGVAAVSNGISGVHREYLRAGGLGFLLGDGFLTYGRETILETYYTAHLWRGVFASGLLQRVWNPGYNRDRGPVIVPGARLHVDF